MGFMLKSYSTKWYLHVPGQRFLAEGQTKLKVLDPDTQIKIKNKSLL